MDADSGLADHGGSHAAVHRYVSTYCQHELCGQCRLRCKICAAPCLCSCHRSLTAGGR